MLNTPLIEIELQPDSTRVPRPGREKHLENESHHGPLSVCG